MGESDIGNVWRVGELASEAGLTVRTLHHYDRIGLVRPTRRSGAGHRLYTEADVQHLYQVLALRQLGLGLDQIAEVLAGTVTIARVLAAHRDRLAVQVAAMQDLHGLVATLAATAQNRPDISTNHFLGLVRRTVMVDDTVEKYFTHDNATAFTALYFAQLTARQDTLELWYAEDAQLTVADRTYVGPTTIFARLNGFPRAGYNVEAIDVQAVTDAAACLRVTGSLALDGAPVSRPFETLFTLNDTGMIAEQMFHST